MKKSITHKAIYSILTCILFITCNISNNESEKDVTKYVNPFIGAGTSNGLAESE